MFYSLLGRLTWMLAKKRLNPRHRRSSRGRRTPLIGLGLATAVGAGLLGRRRRAARR